MNLLEFIKRAVPFLGAFAIGFIISSFFAALSLPTLKLDHGWKSRKYCIVKRENHYLKRKIYSPDLKLSEEEQKLVEIAKTKLANQHDLPVRSKTEK